MEELFLFILCLNKLKKKSILRNNYAGILIRRMDFKLRSITLRSYDWVEEEIKHLYK